MTGKLDLPRHAFLGVKTVGDDGAIRGLDQHRGKDFLLVKVPPLDEATFGRLRDLGAEMARDLAGMAEYYRRVLEDNAERIAKQLDADPQGARRFVREATGFVDVLREAGERAGGERPSGAAGATPSEVAGSIRGGVSALTARQAALVEREARDEQQAIFQEARAAQMGVADWKPRSEPPEAAAPGGRIVDVTDRIRDADETSERKRWDPGAGGP